MHVAILNFDARHLPKAGGDFSSCGKQHYCFKSSDITDMTRHIHEYRMWVPIGIYLSYPTSFRESLGLAWSSSRILHAFSSRVLFIRTNTASTLERLISHDVLSLHSHLRQCINYLSSILNNNNHI